MVVRDLTDWRAHESGVAWDERRSPPAGHPRPAR